jgi:hypothetical protein
VTQHSTEEEEDEASRAKHDSTDLDTMGISDYTQRHASYALTALEDRFEVIKEIGDGSFGSVALARVRANGANVARRNSMVRWMIRRFHIQVLTFH